MDLSFLPDVTEYNLSEGHMLPTEDVLSLWIDIKQKTNFKHIFEIGTNAGHSASIILELFPDVKVTSLDICKYEYTLLAVDILKERYKERFDFIQSDSVKYFNDVQAGIKTFPNGVDILNIDGKHDYETAIIDLELALNTKTPYVLLDDANEYQIQRVIKRIQHNKGVFKECDFDILKEYSYSTRGNDVLITLAKIL